MIKRSGQEQNLLSYNISECVIYLNATRLLFLLLQNITFSLHINQMICLRKSKIFFFQYNTRKYIQTYPYRNKLFVRNRQTLLEKYNVLWIMYTIICSKLMYAMTYSVQRQLSFCGKVYWYETMSGMIYVMTFIFVWWKTDRKSKLNFPLQIIKLNILVKKITSILQKLIRKCRK